MERGSGVCEAVLQPDNTGISNASASINTIVFFIITNYNVD
jgi:uncharacterized membrane protein YtjA (UPF0391 family)